MRKCAYLECQNTVYKPQNRQSVWCWEHLTENILRDAYPPTAEQVADTMLNELAIRQEATRRACAYVPHWTVQDLCAVVLLCIGSVLSVILASWVVVGLSKGIWWMVLQFLRIIRLA